MNYVVKMIALMFALGVLTNNAYANSNCGKIKIN